MTRVWLTFVDAVLQDLRHGIRMARGGPIFSLIAGTTVQRRVIDQLNAMSGVESVSIVGVGTVLGGGSSTAALPVSSSDQLKVGYNEIGPRYFATLRTPIVRGREFDDGDTQDSPPVVIVNETLAARFWPNGQPIGATIVVGGAPRQVVGVVANVSLESRTEVALRQE